MSTRRRTTRMARHSKAQCRKILRTLSEYLDNDLPKSVCREIRKHLGLCPKCEVFVHTLKRTIDLCQKAEVTRLTASDKTKLRKEILTAASRV
ncbi:MAG: anti-sigma factor family protein [Gammaproteobacteria bacterium]